jgi:molybdopterin-guanine dinucleotide biosynthesis protein A
VADRGLTGILLVGGASRRFGSSKAFVRHEGETFAERAWRILGETCGERIAVGKRDDELQVPFPVLDDGTDIRAPIAGLVAGLRAASTDVSIAIPVDMPLLTPAALLELANACRDAAVAQRGPLPGAYHRRALPVLERALADGVLALHEAIAGLDVVQIELPDEVLVNVNTPTDVRRL